MPEVQATRWMSGLMEEIEGFDGNLFPPTEAAPEGEKIIGICPEELRRVYSYMRYCQREARQAQLEQEFVADQAEKDRLQGRFFDMKARANICGLMLWSCVNESFGQWSSVGHFNMRAEWKLTYHECTEDGPTEMLRRIFGGRE